MSENSAAHPKVGITVIGKETLISVNQASPPLLEQGGLTLVGSRQEDQLQILVSQAAFATITSHATSDMSHEVGGFLIGRPYDWNDRHYVEIVDAVPGELTSASVGHLTYTHDTWARGQVTARDKFPNMHIVGWYHTHPYMGVFLSGLDLEIHEGFFRQPWHVAMVVEPSRREAGFFVWEGERVRGASGYQVAFPPDTPEAQRWQPPKTIYTSIRATTLEEFYEVGCWHTRWAEPEEVVVKVRPAAANKLRELGDSSRKPLMGLCWGQVRTSRMERKPFYFVEVSQIESVSGERQTGVLGQRSSIIRTARQLVETTQAKAQLQGVGLYYLDSRHLLSPQDMYQILKDKSLTETWLVVLMGEPGRGVESCLWKATTGELITRPLVQLVNLDQVSEDGLPKALAAIKEACQQLPTVSRAPNREADKLSGDERFDGPVV